MNTIFRKRPLSIQGKLIFISILTSFLLFAVNLILFISINTVMDRLSRSYYSNMLLSDTSAELSNMRESLKLYLDTKSSDAMSAYYGYVTAYYNQVEQITDSEEVFHNSYVVENIRNLSDSYAAATDEALNAKRGRNIDKYQQYWLRSEEIYGFIDACIYSLSNEQIRANTSNYEILRASFGTLRAVSMISITLVFAINIIMISKLTRNIMDPVRQRELSTQAHLKDAQLKYLQAQINPHFLFNTLNAGSQLAMMEDAERTEDYIKKVASFYRYKMHAGKDDTTLGEELDLVDNYIYILNVRFSGDIHYEKKVEESIKGMTVPIMLLQPLVENCVNYGIRDIDREGHIWLDAVRDGDYARISVRDNGIGMSEDKIADIMSGSPPKLNEDSPFSNGVGLRNVITRIELYYGRTDLFNIISGGQDQGTEVVIRLPMNFEKPVSQEGDAADV